MANKGILLMSKQCPVILSNNHEGKALSRVRERTGHRLTKVMQLALLTCGMPSGHSPDDRYDGEFVHIRFWAEFNWVLQ
jgi:hypothetical protein